MVCSVLLHWKNTEDVERLIELLSTWSDVHIVVVDQSGDLTKPARPQLTILTPQRNVGYGGGCNLAISYAIERGLDYLLFLNPDIYIEQSHVQALVSHLSEHPRCQVVAPVLKEYRGERWQYSLGGTDPLTLGQTRIWSDDVPSDDSVLKELTYLPGTVLLARRELFEAYGLLDEKFFFGGEWADYFMKNLRPADWQLLPHIVITHQRNHDARLHPDRIYYHLRNRYRLIDKHGLTQARRLRRAWSRRLYRQYFGAVWRKNSEQARAILDALRDGKGRTFGARGAEVEQPRIWHITTIPIPEVAHTDAHMQEIQTLIDHFGGQCISVYPAARPKPYMPAALYGMHSLRLLRKIARSDAIIQLWSTNYQRYPFLRLLPKNRILYTVMTPLARGTVVDPGYRGVIMHATPEHDAEAMNSTDLLVSPPMAQFVREILPYREIEDFYLLMASAPWTLGQFDMKGVYLLLQALEALPWLRLILVWRGLHTDRMRRLIDGHPAGSRIELLDDIIDIRAIQARTHATVLLTKSSRIVKSYPHSLIESLLCGRPVLLNTKIGMQSDVKKYDCGVVLSELSPATVVAGITELRDRYEHYATQTRNLPEERYSTSAFLEFYTSIYDEGDLSQEG